MRRRGSFASLLAITGALLAAPAVPAATLSVDDDRQDCSAAAFTSVQDAIDAASPGDTIAICPGTYAEGNAQPNTSALKIDKTLTLKGAGADLVTISPLRYDGNDGVIAEDASDPTRPGIPAQDIRRPSGNIVTAVGTAAVPITVDISGVTIDGDGVAAKAGLVFIDAQGSLRRSRVTDIVTSEAPGAYDVPGGYRSGYLGYGVAQVTAAQTPPLGAGPRTLTIATTRIDEYNRVGLLIDGGIDAASPVTPSGVDLRGVISTSQIVGRSLCWDSNVDGQCRATSQTPGNPEPRPIADGPLFGQDGIRLVAGARGAITGSLISQNLVQGQDAPVRNSATNNQHLPKAAGIRLIGADAANSSVARSNIVDNAYGIVNAAGDNNADAANPLRAEDNWWGLWSPIGGTQPSPPNDGPEVSPVSNPPYPENPVNGAAAPDGSTTVDFLPYRSGPQSEPNTGQFPVVPAPIPVSDAAPDVTVAPERKEYRRGETVKLTAEPSDDFGIRRVTFFDGASEVGSDTSPPYTAAYTLPSDAACGTRELAATAEDSLGQTATATSALTVLCDVPGGGTPPNPPTVKLPENLNTIRRSGTTVNVRPESERPITSVDFFLGARQVCRDTSAPYQCRIVPRSSEIGSQTLRVVATDSGGLTGQDSRQVTVPRFTPRGLELRAASKKLSGGRVRRTVTATVLPASGVSRATACRGGRVATVVTRGQATLIDREKRLDGRCSAVVMRYTAGRGASRTLRYKASVRFGGTTVLSTVRKTRRFR